MDSLTLNTITLNPNIILGQETIRIELLDRVRILWGKIWSASCDLGFGGHYRAGGGCLGLRLRDQTFCALCACRAHS